MIMQPFPPGRKQPTGTFPPDRKQPTRNVPPDRKTNYRWGGYSVIEEDYKEDKKEAKRQERRKEKSFPGKSDKKENTGKRFVKDVDSKGRAVKYRSDAARKNVRSDDSRGWSAPKKRNKT